MYVTIKLKLEDVDVLVDQDVLRDDFGNDMVRYLNWCMEPDGGSLSLFDLVNFDTPPKVIDVQ